jgi:hypothetical protein
MLLAHDVIIPFGTELKTGSNVTTTSTWVEAVKESNGEVEDGVEQDNNLCTGPVRANLIKKIDQIR